MTAQRFKDKVILVTGGGSGIGRAAALRFAQEGGRVVIAGRTVSDGEETVKMIADAGGEAITIRCDVGVPEDIDAAVHAGVEKWSRLDIVVSNAAMMTFTPIESLDPKEWDALMNVNLRALFLLTRAALPHLKSGAVIAVSSVHAHQTTPNVIPYAASKGAMEAFIRGCSLEYSRERARFIAVAPGAVDTPMLWSNPNIKSGAEVVTGVVGTVDELAAAICFVASDEASYINGTTLVVDGGRLAAL